jgi:GNAT superfamily N-acetyltransferase
VPVDLDQLQYRPLAEGCPRGAFRCGEADLDSWFFKQATKRHDDHTCRVTTVHLGDAPDPVAFYAMGLVLEEDRYLKKDGGPISRRVFQRVYPALHLEYLAVDKSVQGNGIGVAVMFRALETFRWSVLEMGIPVLTIVPLNADLVDWYRQLGFQSYAQHLGLRRMMMPAKTILEAAAKAGVGPA